MTYQLLAILNPESTFADKAKYVLQKNKIRYVLSNKKSGMKQILEDNIRNDRIKFIVCGGDGTINSFINTYMQLSKNKRNLVTAGFLPCGKTNDLTRALDVPGDLEKALGKILKNKSQNIDLIKVNKSYFITGGGLGLITDVVKDADRISSGKKGKFLSRCIKDIVYVLAVIKNILFRYAGLEVTVSSDNKKKQKLKNLMLLSVQNQKFIGKRFFLTPKANNSDGVFELVFVEKPDNLISDFVTIRQIIKGQHLKSGKAKEIRAKKVSIYTKKRQQFMADGELLCFSDKFRFEIIPKAIRVCY